MVKFISINSYCPLAKMANDVVNGIYSVDFGKVSVTPTLFTVSGVGASKDFEEAPIEIDAEYGRNIVLVADGANSSSVKVHGYDFLGQPMEETLTLNGTTAVSGKKAFKFIQKINIPNSTNTTVTVKAGNVLGLPYRTAAILAQTKDGVAGNTGTLVVPVNTLQTATSGDPRGTISLASYATAAHIVVVCLASPEIFTIEDVEYGGLQGLPHYFE